MGRTKAGRLQDHELEAIKDCTSATRTACLHDRPARTRCNAEYLQRRFPDPASERGLQTSTLPLLPTGHFVAAGASGPGIAVTPCGINSTATCGPDTAYFDKRNVAKLPRASTTASTSLHKLARIMFVTSRGAWGHPRYHATHVYRSPRIVTVKPPGSPENCASLRARAPGKCRAGNFAAGGSSNVAAAGRFIRLGPPATADCMPTRDGASRSDGSACLPRSRVRVTWPGTMAAPGGVEGSAGPARGDLVAAGGVVAPNNCRLNRWDA